MPIGLALSPEDFDGSAHARVTAADERSALRVERAAEALLLADDLRLDDRTRAAVRARLVAIVEEAEAGVRREAARQLAENGAPGPAESLLRGESILARLVKAGLLRDHHLMEEVVAGVELDLLGDAAFPGAAQPDQTSLLVRLARCPDHAIAEAAAALLAIETRRRTARERSGPVGHELSAETQQRLIWRVAAAIRLQAPTAGDPADRDRALTDAVLHRLAVYDEGDRPAVAATSLAAAIDAQVEELPSLLLEALGDARPALFVALLARAGSMEFEPARELVLDQQSDLLMLALHAIGLNRRSMAAIGVVLADADPRRDLERLADGVDWAVGHDRSTANAALAPHRLGRDFRAALRRFDRAG